MILLISVCKFNAGSSLSEIWIFMTFVFRLLFFLPGALCIILCLSSTCSASKISTTRFQHKIFVWVCHVEGLMYSHNDKRTLFLLFFVIMLNYSIFCHSWRIYSCSWGCLGAFESTYMVRGFCSCQLCSVIICINCIKWNCEYFRKF